MNAANKDSLPTRVHALLACLALGVVPQVFAQSTGMRTYCNPLDINYQYNFEHCNEDVSYRSGADPVIVNHENEAWCWSVSSFAWLWQRSYLPGCSKELC